MEYPVAETFASFQGEGAFAGTSMYFIRLAGCTVGKPFPKEMYQDRDLPLDTPGNISGKALPIYTEKCTLYDGREFPCDTDYRVHERLSVVDILSRVPYNYDRVCITGGEPLMHNLESLVTALKITKFVHIETSGTQPFQKCLSDNKIWVTLSPKR
jgi:organic radical activating enzyme